MKARQYGRNFSDLSHTTVSLINVFEILDTNLRFVFYHHSSNGSLKYEICGQFYYQFGTFFGKFFLIGKPRLNLFEFFSCRGVFSLVRPRFSCYDRRYLFFNIPCHYTNTIMTDSSGIKPAY